MVMKSAMQTLSVLTAGALLLAALPVDAQELEPGIYNPKQSTPTTMYFHINGFQDFPVNTQKPSDKYAESVQVGLATHSSCAADPTGTQRFTSGSHHTWYGYSSPSIVEYDVDENGKPRIHQERGISYDVQLDGNVVPKFTWFLEGRNPDAVPTNSQHPPISNVIVRATMREGDDVSVGNEAFNQGAIIAQGQSLPTTLAGGATGGEGQDAGQVEAIQDGDRWIYKFEFDLDYDKTMIDKDESFNVRVDAFMDNPYCNDPSSSEGGDYAMLDYALVHTSPDFRPKLAWAVMNPLYIEALHPQFVGDDLVVHTASNSPWGSYDVQGDIAIEQPMKLEINGPSPALSLDQVALVENTRGHHNHNKAVTATWLWDFQADQAKDGVYTVQFKVKNDQETAEATAVATFTIGAGKAEVCAKNVGDNDFVCQEATEGVFAQDEESPGLPLVGLLAALGAGAYVIRRRN